MQYFSLIREVKSRKVRYNVLMKRLIGYGGIGDRTARIF